MDKHFPSDVHRTPELLVGNAECTGVPLEAIDSHGACEKNVCRGECCEFGHELCYDFTVSVCLWLLSARHTRFPVLTLWLLCARVR